MVCTNPPRSTIINWSSGWMCRGKDAAGSRVMKLSMAFLPQMRREFALLRG